MIYHTELEQSRVLDELDDWKSAIHASEDSILNLKKELKEDVNFSGGREMMAKHYQIIQDSKFLQISKVERANINWKSLIWKWVKIS